MHDKMILFWIIACLSGQLSYKYVYRRKAV